MAYYTIKREMAPLSLGITRTLTETPRDKYTRVYVDKKYTIEVWASNLTLDDISGVEVVLEAWDVETGEKTYHETLQKDAVLLKNQTTELISCDVPVKNKNIGEEGRIVVAAYVVQGGKQLARYCNWPEPLKYAHLQKPKQLKVALTDDLTFVEISAEVPVKGVSLECEDDEVKFEDNLVDIVPGEIVRIAVKGAGKDTKVTSRYLGML
jgi:beta-mannosidase